MANAQTRATKKWQEKVELKSCAYKIHKQDAEAFKTACNTNSESQSAVLTKLMKQYIKKDNDNNIDVLNDPEFKKKAKNINYSRSPSRHKAISEMILHLEAIKTAEENTFNKNENINQEHYETIRETLSEVISKLRTIQEILNIKTQNINTQNPNEQATNMN